MFIPTPRHSAPASYRPFSSRPIFPTPPESPKPHLINQRKDISKLIKAENIAQLEKLLDAHPHLLDGPDANGNTPLIEAVLMDKLPVAEALLKKGAKPDKFDAFGETALMKAAENRNFKAMHLLLDYNASPRVMGLYSKEPLLISTVRWGDDSLPVTLRILKHYTHPNQSDAFGMTPLITAIQNYAPETTVLLLERGASTNQADISGKSPLMYAVKSPKLTQLLLEHGANPNYYSKKLNQDVVETAILTENLETLKILAHYKARITPENLELAEHLHGQAFHQKLSELFPDLQAQSDVGSETDTRKRKLEDQT